MTDVETRDALLAKLSDSFEPNQIGKLPRAVRKDDQDKGKCEPGSKYSADGSYCGGWHVKSVHLDYVGHAAVTARLLDVDREWTWEPVAWTADGLPATDKLGGMWIKLTVLGVTRLGYGDAQGKTGPNAIKETIGDALRNAAMRFGAGLELWHKGDLYEAATPDPVAEQADPVVSELNALKRQLLAAGQLRGLGLQDLSKRFADSNGGMLLHNATIPELATLLADLNGMPVAP